MSTRGTRDHIHTEETAECERRGTESVDRMTQHTHTHTHRYSSTHTHARAHMDTRFHTSTTLCLLSLSLSLSRRKRRTTPLTPHPPPLSLPLPSLPSNTSLIFPEDALASWAASCVSVVCWCFRSESKSHKLIVTMQCRHQPNCLALFFFPPRTKDRGTHS